MRKIEYLYYGYYLRASNKKWDKSPEFTALLSPPSSSFATAFQIK